MVSIVNDLSADTGDTVVVRRVGICIDDGTFLAKNKVQPMDLLKEWWKITRVRR